MRNFYLFLIYSIALFCSCTSSVHILKPQGESATFTFTNSSKYQVEMLAISDSTIFVKYENKICSVKLKDVNKIYIRGYRVSPSLKILTAIPLILIEGIVMFVAFDVEQHGWGVISGATMAGTIYGFETGDPKTKFSVPFNESEIEKLKLFCRYPQNLGSERWKILLQHFNQDDFLRLSKNSKYKKN